MMMRNIAKWSVRLPILAVIWVLAAVIFPVTLGLNWVFQRMTNDE